MKFRPLTAFTVVELLVVAAIVSILSATLLPALSRAKEKALRIKCVGNLKQLGVVEQTWANDHDGWFYIHDNPHPYTAGSSQPGFFAGPHFLEGLSNYAVKTDILYCPSALRRKINHPNSLMNYFGNQTIQPWSQLRNSHTHYGYITFLGNWMDARQILFFENPTYVGHGTIMTSTQFTGGSIYIELGSGNLYQSNGTTLWASPNGGLVSDANHGTEGSNVLYVDGRVEWQSGRLIGPVYGSSASPPGYSGLSNPYVIGAR